MIRQGTLLPVAVALVMALAAGLMAVRPGIFDTLGLADEYAQVWEDLSRGLAGEQQLSL